MKRTLALALALGFAGAAAADDTPTLRAAEKLALDLFGGRSDAAIAALLKVPPDPGSARSPTELRDAAIGESGRARRVFEAHIAARTEDTCTVAVPMLFEKGRRDIVLVIHGCTLAPGTLRSMRLADPMPAATPTAAPAKPPVAPYVETRLVGTRALTIDAEGTSLPAEFVFPRPAAGRAPVLVLVPGEGFQDLDGGAGARRPLRDLALALAQEGVASLRFTKRATMDPRLATDDGFGLEEDVLADARAALGLAAVQPEADPSRIYLGGHGLGAIAAAKLAGTTPDVDGLLLLSPPARFDAGLVARRKLWLSERNLLDRETALEAADAAASIAQGGTPWSGALDGYSASYWRDVAAVDPLREASLFTGPVLVLFGGRSFDVAASDADAWAAALRARRNARVQMEAAADSWFYFGSGVASPADDLEPGHMMPEVIERIAAYLATGELPVAAPLR
jgi:alpha/beta superfamily hydrolase